MTEIPTADEVFAENANCSYGHELKTDATSLLYDLNPYSDLPHPDQRTLESAQLAIHDGVLDMANHVTKLSGEHLERPVGAAIVIGLFTGLCRVLSMYNASPEEMAKLCNGLAESMPVEIEYWRRRRQTGECGEVRP